MLQPTRTLHRVENGSGEMARARRAASARRALDFLAPNAERPDPGEEQP